MVVEAARVLMVLRVSTEDGQDLYKVMDLLYLGWIRIRILCGSGSESGFNPDRQGLHSRILIRNKYRSFGSSAMHYYIFFQPMFTRVQLPWLHFILQSKYAKKEQDLELNLYRNSLSPPPPASYKSKKRAICCLHRYHIARKVYRYCKDANDVVKATVRTRLILYKSGALMTKKD